tara:strand:- start:39 stop:1091 length:1053 start_codon:yes stop_codon:yes gene_type:complete
MCGDDGDELGLETEFMEDCCALTPWEIDKSKVEGGQNYCRPDGTRWEKRELVNRTLCRGDSEYLAYEDRMRRVPCCYKTAWKNDEVCGFFENGKQKEIRTIENADMCVVDATDDLSSEKYTPCCDIGPWSYGGENLDGQLGKVKEVREVYNCPPDVDDKQYEKTVCYKGAWEDYGCDKKFRQQSRTVLNCPVGTSSSQEVEENRNQKTIMNNCYNISGVSYITLSGTERLSSATIYYDILENGGNRYRKTWNMDSEEVKFDTPVDIYNVYNYLKTYGNDANLITKFYTASNVLIRTLNHYVAKAADGSYKTNWKYNSNWGEQGWEYDTVYYSNYETSVKDTNKPMLETLG